MVTMGYPFTYGFWFYEELLPLLNSGQGKVWIETPGFGKHLVTANSTKLKCLRRSPMCANCDRVGLIWMLQSQKKLHPSSSGLPHKPKGTQYPHLNLWALDGDRLVLMTQDHIFPRSKGGSNGMHNLQTMCSDCNTAKGDSIPHEYARSFIHAPTVDGRGPSIKGLSEVHEHALSVLDYLERKAC